MGGSNRFHALQCLQPALCLSRGVCLVAPAIYIGLQFLATFLLFLPRRARRTPFVDAIDQPADGVRVRDRFAARLEHTPGVGSPADTQREPMLIEANLGRKNACT